MCLNNNGEIILAIVRSKDVLDVDCLRSLLVGPSGKHLVEILSVEVYVSQRKAS